MVVYNNILAGAAGSGGSGYEIERSLRFNRADSSNLSRTPSSQGNRRTWTWSLWVKRSDLTSNLQGLFGAGVDDYDYTGLYFQDDEIKLEDYPGGGIVRSQPVVLRDVSAWYHIVIAVDTTQSTAADRVKFYLNGVQLTTSGTWAQNTQTRFNKTQVHKLGKFYPSGGSNDHFTGYLAEVHFVDGQQLAPTDFGEFSDTGVWNPIEFTGSHNAAAVGLGGVTWSSYVSGPVNSTKPLSLCFGGTIGSGYQQGTTATGGNALTLNVSALNLTVTNVRLNSFIGGSPGTLTVNGSNVSYSGSGDQTQVVAVNGQLNTIVWGYDNGNNYVYMRGIEVDLGDGSGYRLLTDGAGTPAGVNGFHLDFSDNSSNAALGYDAAGSNNWTVNNLSANSPGLSTANQGFNAVTWTGDGSNSRAINLGFQPDFLWIKRRDANYDHIMWDSIRGITKEIHSNYDYAEGTATNKLESFDTNGFTVKNNGGTNQNSATYVAWAWKAGGTSSSNSYGTITSSVSANNTYGFSIVTYTGNSTAGATVGHGLSTAPSMIWVKNRSRAANWAVGHSGVNGFANGNQLRLNTTGAVASSEEWFNNTNPTSSVFTVKNNYEVNYANDNYVAYCWSEVSGFSKFGGYAGNSDNSTVTNRVIDCGFKPKYVLIKCSSNAGEEWMIFDGARNTSNPRNLFLKAESGNGDGSYAARHISFVDNGFKFEGSNGQEPLNLSGRNYIFAAFADMPDGTIIDSLIDTPTDYEASNGNNGGNYCTFNALNKTGGVTLSNGNLDAACTANSTDRVVGTIAIPRSGKYYFEFTIGSNYFGYVGISNNDKTKLVGRNEDGRKYTEAGHVSTPFTSFTPGDVIGVALNNNTTLTFYKNGVAESTTVTVDSDQDYFPFANFYNATFILNAGQRPFAYTPPTGYVSLCTQNLPDPLIADSSTAFDAKLYTGNGTSQTISGYNFSPDFAWFKSRNGTDWHALVDTVRGNTKVLFSNSSNGEETRTEGVSSFNSDGFSLGDYAPMNKNNDSLVAWAWDAGSSNTSITAGSLNSSAYDQSQTWSTYGSVTAGSFSPAITELFDNDLTSGPSSGAGTTSTWTFTSGITASSSIEIYCLNGSGPSGTQTSGTEIRLTVGGTVHSIDGSPGWINTGLTGSLTAITIHVTAGSGSSGLRAIKVDGKELVDSGVTVTNVPSIASTVRANPSAGFSIVTYSGDNSTSGSVGHGLNASPSMVIIKQRNGTKNWKVGHTSLASTHMMTLDETYATGASSWNGVDSNVFYPARSGDTYNNTSGDNYVAYCFAPVAGYSSAFSFTGTGADPGPFVYLGFKPKLIIVKRTDNSNAASHWRMIDMTINPYNVADTLLYANSSASEITEVWGEYDALSNGFRVMTPDSNQNASGGSYIGFAWAEHPFQANGGLAR